MDQRTTKRQAVWDNMLKLEQEGLGVRETVSDQRDRFMLDARHGAATALSRRPEAKGFIRADRDTLLFRDATGALRDRLEAVKPGLATGGDKGFEVRWSAVDETDIGRMFDAVRALAATISAT